MLNGPTVMKPVLVAFRAKAPEWSGKFHLAMGPELRCTLPQSTECRKAVPSKDSDAAIDPTRDIANG